MIQGIKINTDGTLSIGSFLDSLPSDYRDISYLEDNGASMYYKEDGSIDVDKEVELELETYNATTKQSTLKAIDTMRVEVDGLGYDGDETATTRMQKAITTLVGEEKINWRLYDNSMAVVTQTELGKAMRAAGILMSKLWFCESVEEVEAIVGLDPVWLDKYKAQ